MPVARTAPSAARRHAGQHTDEVLTEYGFDAYEVAQLRETGAVA
ncbi:MAG: hypothetical protein R2695_01215 [Acidimicrobiales bacterium]